ncbi:MAG: imidazole glycerol phosphate synthase subunit HisH [Ignavibacteriae bacterium]|nr:imidazole glycerol phosphate synthase subunit HisH [Ignavibacteriota bacterium]
MIGVVDYDAGNIASVSNALSAIGAEYCVSSGVDLLAQCDGIILPGVGAAPGAMTSLRQRGLIPFLRSVNKPLLGICLVMQLLFESSEEGETLCLAVLPGTIKRLSDRAEKIPHMGWNMVTFTAMNPLIEGIDQSAYFYFAHSFVATVNGTTLGTAECGEVFTAALAYKNYFGVQFHPEKSGKNGLTILKNFETQCRSYRP